MRGAIIRCLSLFFRVRSLRSAWPINVYQRDLGVPLAVLPMRRLRADLLLTRGEQQVVLNRDVFACHGGTSRVEALIMEEGGCWDMVGWLVLLIE